MKGGGVADTSQGDGWWQASDRKWYPPETHPDYQPPPPEPPTSSLPPPQPKRPIDYIAQMPDRPQPDFQRGRDEYILAGISAVIVVAAFMPWASVFFFTVNGIDGDGQITAVAAGIVACVALFGRSRGAIGVFALIGGIITAGVGIYDLSNIEGVANDSGGVVSAGSGLWLTAIAGCALVAAAIWYLRQDGQPQPS